MGATRPRAVDRLQVVRVSPTTKLSRVLTSTVLSREWGVPQSTHWHVRNEFGEAYGFDVGQPATDGEAPIASASGPVPRQREDGVGPFAPIPQVLRLLGWG